MLTEASAQDSLYRFLLEKGPLKKGPLETQERCPPVQVCQQDLEARPTTEPNKEPPHDRNDDLRGRELQDDLENLLEEEELYDALNDDDSSPGKEVEANEVEEKPRDGPQQGIEGPTEVLLQEWPHHGDMGCTDEPSKQGSARRAEATTDEDDIEVEEVTTKKAATELRAIPEPPSRASKLSPQDEPPGRSLESSLLVAEVAEELQHLQLPWEQPQQGLADDRADVSNKEPLH